MTQFKKLYKDYFCYFKYRIIILISLIFITILINSLSPFIFGKVIDTIVDKNAYKIKDILLFYISINIVVSMLGQIQGLLRQSIVQKLSNNIKISLFSKITIFTSESRDKYNTGELVNRIESDSDGIVNFYIDLITNTIAIIANLGISLFFLLSISPVNAGIALLNVIFMIIVNLVFKENIKKIQNKQNKFHDDYQGFIHETIDNSKHIKIFLLEEKMRLKFSNYMDKGYLILRKSQFLFAQMNFIKSIAFGVINFFMLYVFAQFISSGILTIGNMVSFNSYIARLYDSISQIMSLHVTSISIKLSIERIEQINSEECECLLDQDDKFDLKKITSLSCNDLHFSYPTQLNKNILKSISIEIDNPGFYCIVGQNGSGKSTIAKLIMKLYTCDDNKLFINKININSIPCNILRDNIVYIPKETYIFNDSILNNLLIANPKCQLAEIIKFSKIARLHNDILLFENQYETLVGANGVELSSGQQQKLNFVRALMKKGSFYIFDEITSDLDGSSEQDLISSIKSIADENIVMLITHRISSAKYADETYVLKDGMIESSGSHDCLLNNSEEYNLLFGYQEKANI